MTERTALTDLLERVDRAIETLSDSRLAIIEHILMNEAEELRIMIASQTNADALVAYMREPGVQATLSVMTEDARQRTRAFAKERWEALASKAVPVQPHEHIQNGNNR